MRHGTIVLAVLGLVLAGCQWAGPTALEEPLPADGGAARVAQPAAEDLDLLGTFGREDAARFETPAYTGLQQNSFCEVGADMDVDAGPDGEHVVFASSRHAPTPDIYVKKVNGRTVTRLTTDPGRDIQPVYSPDGRFIAFASDRSGNWDLYVMTAEGQRAFQVADTPMHEIHPSWSPDGSRLSYCQYNARSAQWEIWIVEVANPASKKFITIGLYPVWCPSPSVDRIAFQQARRRGTRLFGIWTVDLVGDEARYPTEIVPPHGNTAALAPAWSPDGSNLVYTTVDLVEKTDPATGEKQPQRVERGNDVWVTSLDGSCRVRLTGDHTADWNPVWAADGRIYFTSNRSGRDNIWSLKPTDTRLIRATMIGPSRVGSADGPQGAAERPSPEAARSGEVEANQADVPL